MCYCFLSCFVLKLLLAIISYDGVYGQVKTCDDCILFSQCPYALERVIKRPTNETVQLFKNALYGFEHEDHQKVPLVCCSDFRMAPSTDAIETHPNLGLLPKTCGEIAERRILGGNHVFEYEYPWMALIAYRKDSGIQFGCGGSIINSRYILTAAHCLRNKNIGGVRVGEYDTSNSLDCNENPPNMICESHVQDFAVEEVVVHPNFTVVPTVKNDIALLRLENQIDFSYKNVNPICLPISQELRKPLKDGDRAEVVGRGVTETEIDSSVPTVTSLPILSSETCSQLYSRPQKMNINFLTENEFCAGELDKDTCVGDSGGPLILEKKYNGVYSWVQYGINTRELKRCRFRYPGVYTDVSKYMNWILDSIKQ